MWALLACAIELTKAREAADASPGDASLAQTYQDLLNDFQLMQVDRDRLAVDLEKAEREINSLHAQQVTMTEDQLLSEQRRKELETR